MNTDHTTRNYFTGVRMMDVRIQIAASSDGLDRVTKITAGHYIITTHDGRTWTVTQRSSGTWYGEVEAAEERSRHNRYRYFGDAD